MNRVPRTLTSSIRIRRIVDIHKIAGMTVGTHSYCLEPLSWQRYIAEFECCIHRIVGMVADMTVGIHKIAGMVVGMTVGIRKIVDIHSYYFHYLSW